MDSRFEALYPDKRVDLYELINAKNNGSTSVLKAIPLLKKKGAQFYFSSTMNIDTKKLCQLCQAAGIDIPNTAEDRALYRVLRHLAWTREQEKKPPLERIRAS